MSQSFGEEHKEHDDVLPKKKKEKKINLSNFFSFFKKNN